ncbi:SAV_2336 N-terminal domain-related protein [Sulfurovum sp. TSL1]|uniref:SAV_2336 N-terminal domain-related protein n=1 Tax=Sulfurovum sp. TSL1 TaxID=2826994 RepID=UPI001CC7DE38|nr:SAV_2336 N-terminal domain-related protein [Sulfurovum sp. TSL1]GIT97912.1 hypothetical protein TSL1_07330 [Sulfurovum sp. TSL1]
MNNLDIASYIDLLESSNLDTTELSDILWLAKYMKTDKSYYIRKEKEVSEESVIKNKESKPKEEIKDQPSKEKKSETITENKNDNISLSLDKSTIETSLEINISHRGYFNDTQQISKYLIDFKDKFSSKRKNVLNEIKTIDYKAKTGVLNPFFKPKKKKLYTLYIFIDSSSSMKVWKGVIDEYSKLLVNSGIFKASKLIYFNSDKDETVFYKDTKLNRIFNPKEITNFQNNKLIFVLTDMLSSGWQYGDTLEVFAKLYDNIPLYVVQMLPYRLWRTTALKKASITTFHSSHYYPTRDSYNTEIDYLLRSLDENSSKTLKLPIVSFELAYLKTIGKTLKAQSENKIDGAIFNLDSIQENKSTLENKTLTPDEKVKYFFANASPEAQELAKSLSSVQFFNLPIMRMIQDKTLNESSNTYIAEVINSGLVKNNDNLLEFDNDVCDVLFQLLGRKKALEIAYNNSDYIQENLGAEYGFKAYLTGRINLKDNKLTEIDKKFATMPFRILKSMGGKYAEMAKNIGAINQKIQTENVSPLKNEVYQPVFHQDAFFPRKDIIDQIWSVLDKNYNILLSAPRRFGKTSIIKHIVNEPQNNYLIKYLDMESLDNSDAFFTTIYRALLDLIGRSDIDASILLNNSSMSLEIKGLLKNTALHNKKIVFIVDEFMIDIQSQDYKNNFMQQLDELSVYDIQFIFATPYAYQATNSAFMRNLYQINIPPLTFVDAEDLMNRLLLASKINIDRSLKHYILEKIGLLIPFYIQFVIKGLIDRYDHQNISKKIIDQYLDEVIQKDLLHFSFWKENLDHLMRNNELTSALSILNYISMMDMDSVNNSNEFIRRDGTLSREKVLNKLRSHYYINESSRFISPLLQQWWKNNIVYSEDDIRSLVLQKLKNQDWNDKDILSEYSLPNKRFADIVLLENGQPVAAIELKAKLNYRSIKQGFNQVVLYAKELNVPITYISDGKKIFQYNFVNNITEEVDRFPSPDEFLKIRNDAYHETKKDISFQCEECETEYFLDCNELEWEQVGGSERNMGAELEHEAEYYNTCGRCNNDMSITFSCWEYPVGMENFRDVSSQGVINLRGDCCRDFHDNEKELMNNEDYSNESNEDEQSRMSDDNNSYLSLEDKIEELETFKNNLIPYANLEYTSEYDREDYSDEDEYPEPTYLISEEFDSQYLDKLINDIQDEIDEAQHALLSEDSNPIHIGSLLLKKQFRIPYNGISESYGIDKDCNVYPDDNEQLLYVYPLLEDGIEEDIHETGLEKIEEWFFQNYEDPANLLPYDSKEGGYIPIYGSLMTAEDAIINEFSGVISDDAIYEAIYRIDKEHGLMEWSPIPNDQEDFDESLDDRDDKELDENKDISNKSDNDFLNVIKRNGKIEALDVTKFKTHIKKMVNDVARIEKNKEKHDEWIKKKNKNIDMLRGKKNKKK